MPVKGVCIEFETPAFIMRDEDILNSRHRNVAM